MLPSADGVEDGLWIVNQLMAQDVRVLNTPSALLAGHDKLLTARLLEGARLPHPRTARLAGGHSVAGGWIVLEVNAAVEFRPVYSPTGDAFAAAADALSGARFLVGA